MTLTVSGLLMLAAVACFVLALLVSAANLAGVGPFDAWLAGGLLAWALAGITHRLGVAPTAPPAGP